MALKVLHPQEVEVFYLLPALRKEIAVNLKAQKLNQKEIAVILGVTEAAVSQYFSEKRANEIKLTKEIKQQVQDVSKNIRTPPQFVYETQQLLNRLLETKATCEFHKQVNGDIPANCTMCFDGKVHP
ncbi:MAG TPA: hypothetical protein VLJ21_02970 [Candidatus Binatia bacterium]|nr:hypothetical protein [Candidatus Binatia bacterium]